MSDGIEVLNELVVGIGDCAVGDAGLNFAVAGDTRTGN